jgi:hypothetical protein
MHSASLGLFFAAYGDAENETALALHHRSLGRVSTVWCLAGEGTMPYYLSKTPKEDAKLQKEGWTEIARYVKATDPLRLLAPE